MLIEKLEKEELKKLVEEISAHIDEIKNSWTAHDGGLSLAGSDCLTDLERAKDHILALLAGKISPKDFRKVLKEENDFFYDVILLGPTAGYDCYDQALYYLWRAWEIVEKNQNKVDVEPEK